MKTKIQPNRLFNTRFHVEQAYQYVDDIIETLRPEDRITAYTAAYVLHNAVIKHYEEEKIKEEV